MASTLVIPPSLLPYLTGQLTDDSSLQESIIQINAVFIAVVTVCASLRMYVRFWLLRCAGIDDALMILALVCGYVLFGSCLAGAKLGLGKHIWNLSSNLLDIPVVTSNITKLLYVCYISYATSIALAKLAIITSYLRIFPNPWFRKLMYIVGFVVLAFWIASIFAVIFTCIPVQAAWDYSITNKKCFDVVNFFYVSTGFNIATDVIVCVSPMPLLWAMALPLKQRYIICMLFSLGVFACISSILRLTQLYQLGEVDLSYQTASSLNWSVAEVGTALVCASLSSMRPLAAKLFPRLFSEYYSQRMSGYREGFRTKGTVQEKSLSHQSADLHGIHVQHTIEFDELRIASPVGNGLAREFENVFGPPLYEKSSNEELMNLEVLKKNYGR